MVVVSTTAHTGYDTTTNTWMNMQTSGTPPSSRNDVAYHADNEKVFIYGGHAQDGYSNELFQLQREPLTWSEITTTGATLPRATSAAICHHNNVVFILGGRDIGNHSTMYTVNLDTKEVNTPLTLPSLLTGEQREEPDDDGRTMGIRFHHMFTTNDDKEGARIVVLGGCWEAEYYSLPPPNNYIVECDISHL